MNSSQMHSINSRTLTTFHTIENEIKLDPQKNYLFDLSYLGIMDLEGAKALEYLQGQISCDLRQMSKTSMCRGAFCNLKGRILSLADCFQWNGLKLVLPKDMLDSTQTSLMKTAQLSRVQLQQADTYRIYGFYLKNLEDILPFDADYPRVLHGQISTSDYCYYNIGKGFYIILISTKYTNTFCQPFRESNQFLGSLTWHTLQLEQSQIEIYPESKGLFLPHRLYLHETPYLAFNKGCYKGQEVIARMHYKATLKHDFKIFEIQTTEKLYSGQLIKKTQEQTELGELIDYSKRVESTYVIAVSVLKNAPQTVLFDGHVETIELMPI